MALLISVWRQSDIEHCQLPVPKRGITVLLWDVSNWGCSSLITLISLHLVKNAEIKACHKYSGKDANVLALARKDVSLNIF